MIPSPSTHYDAIVVGARVAGAPTAMLLARAGARVLLVDRAQRGSDTQSTHALMRGAVLQLRRWGLLDRLIAGGTPPVRATTFRYGDSRIRVDVKPRDGIDALYGPRRTVLDPLLVAAAEEAGVETWFGARVTALLRGDRDRVSGVRFRSADGSTRTFTSDIVIGADGAESFVARSAGAPITRRGHASSATIIGYVDGLLTDSFEWAYRPGSFAGYVPTDGGQTCVAAAMTSEGFRATGRRDVRAVAVSILREFSPDVADLVADPAVRLTSFPGRPGFFRRATGPGWALVGDAGHWKDPAGAHGITDALRDAELLASAVIAGETASFEAERDRIAVPFFDTLERLTRFDWTLDELGPIHLQLAADMSAQLKEVPWARDDAIAAGAGATASAAVRFGVV